MYQLPDIVYDRQILLYPFYLGIYEPEIRIEILKKNHTACNIAIWLYLKLMLFNF